MAYTAGGTLHVEVQWKQPQFWTWIATGPPTTLNRGALELHRGTWRYSVCLPAWAHRGRGRGVPLPFRSKKDFFYQICNSHNIHTDRGLRCQEITSEGTTRKDFPGGRDPQRPPYWLWTSALAKLELKPSKVPPSRIPGSDPAVGSRPSLALEQFSITSIVAFAVKFYIWIPHGGTNNASLFCMSFFYWSHIDGINLSLSIIWGNYAPGTSQRVNHQYRPQQYI